MRPTSTQLVYGLPEPVGTSTSAIQDLTKTTTLELKAPPRVSELDASKVILNLTDRPKAVPKADEIVFGTNFTDHMLVIEYDPENGWAAPVIQPYQNLSLDPASSCLQYATTLFEGMKAYLSPDGEPRLFRPELNMKRMKRSAERLALPMFDETELLTLIKKLVTIDKKWIPSEPGYSLYLRPTMIGTKKYLGVAASTHAMIYVIACPGGPYFGNGNTALPLYAVSESVRAWPGGTGSFKLGSNYASGFDPQRRAAALGYKQCLWLLEENGEHKVTEAGAMNFFVVLKKEGKEGEKDGLEVVTPPLDGTILPGVTRDSILRLCDAHGPETPLPDYDPETRLEPHERSMTMSQLQKWAAEGRLVECFCVGTAVIVASVDRIGYGEKEITLPQGTPIANALLSRLQSIQEGKFEWQAWSVKC